MNLIAYILRAELRNGSVYIELLQNDDSFRGAMHRRFPNIHEAETAIFQGFGFESVSVRRPYEHVVRRYRVQTNKDGLRRFGFTPGWIEDARAVRVPL